jgi:hypothetical protein
MGYYSYITQVLISLKELFIEVSKEVVILVESERLIKCIKVQTKNVDNS